LFLGPVPFAYEVGDIANVVASFVMLLFLISKNTSGGPSGGQPFEKVAKQVLIDLGETFVSSLAPKPAFKVAHLAAGVIPVKVNLRIRFQTTVMI
jgi:hypothetical protein